MPEGMRVVCGLELVLVQKSSQRLERELRVY
jgi:hypothetical protein